MSNDIKYFERCVYSALIDLEKAHKEGRIPQDDAYVLTLVSVIDSMNPQNGASTEGVNVLVVGLPEGREGEEPRLSLQERITYVAGVMQTLINFIQTGFEEAKQDPAASGFLLTDEDFDGDLKEKAMEACSIIISGIAEQYEEDKNRTWN